MTRVFEKGSRLTIERMIEGFLSSLSDLHDQRQFDALHDDFCDRFTNTIRRAKAKEGEDPRASYGQAAKVLDVSLKACVDYCQLPDPATSQRIKPFLHAGIDTPILCELNRREGQAFKASTIREIDRNMYLSLQDAVARHIEDEFNGLISRVMYDNIMWRRLNRTDGDQA